MNSRAMDGGLVSRSMERNMAQTINSKTFTQVGLKKNVHILVASDHNLVDKRMQGENLASQ